MRKIPDELRITIARNIRELRLKKFPGRGGGKKCAEAFGLHVKQNVSPQQWSPWERGMRTPGETRMMQIADFFNVTVAFLREDHTNPKPKEIPVPQPGRLPPSNAGGFLPPPDPPAHSGSEIHRVLAKFLGDIRDNGLRIRLSTEFLGDIGSNGLRVRLSTEDMDYLSQRLADVLTARGMTTISRE